MRISEHFGQLEERIQKLEKEVEALKAEAARRTVLEGNTIGKLPEKKPRAQKATGK